MITGATGYVAGWIVKRFLDEGIDVHAAVRNPAAKEKIKHLEEMAANSSASIKFFKADLLEEGSYFEAMQGCSVVMHTASPFLMGAKNVQQTLIEPALKGTRNVLNSVNKTESVQRVVVTSSCAAIYGDNIDLKETKNGVFTEEDWNVTSNENHQAYSYSKTVAERAAWEMAEAQDRWTLVTANPAFILGPSTQQKTTSPSWDIIKQMGDGTMKMGAPKFEIGVVDVRDLADGHLILAYKEEAKGRHIFIEGSSTFLNMADIVRKKHGDKYPLPKKTIPKFLVWLMSGQAGMTKKEVSRSVGHPWKGDNSKSIKELGMKYRPFDDTMNDMFDQAIEKGLFA